jgi:peptidyl-Lys metalloendopeptidase
MIFAFASTLLLTATSVVAAPGLSLKVSGPPQVTNVDNFSVVATIVNTGDETLKLFNDPRGTLSPFHTNSFTIVSERGDGPEFSGAKVKYGFEAAAKSGNVKAFTVLAPGQSVDVTHDLSAAYNFNSTGATSYSVEPSTLFHYIDALGNVQQIYAHVTDAHTTSLAGNLVSSKLQARSRFRKRASFKGCSAAEQAQIKASIPEAIEYVVAASNYMKSRASGTQRFTTWFGTFSASRANLVQKHYQNIITNTPDLNGYTYECNPSGCDDGVFAFVNPDDFGHISLCSAFWTAPVTGTNSKAGTIVHESSHFTKNGGTDDHAYGHSDAQALAKSNPSQAVMNADSHEYFAENTPALA